MVKKLIIEKVLFLGSAILAGIILSTIVIRFPVKKKKQEKPISKEHIQECIGLSFGAGEKKPEDIDIPF